MMKLKEIKEGVKTQIGAFYISLFSQKRQIEISMRGLDKQIQKILEDESHSLATSESKLCYKYWEAYKEMIKILVILEDMDEISKAYKQMGVIIDNESFNYYLPEISQLIHSNHPFWMKIKFDVSGGVTSGD